MNELLTKQLIETFPNLYSNKDPREPFNYGEAGFECGDGWYKLIYNLSNVIEQELLTMNVRDRANYNVAQVKSKFGTLRFYMTSMTESMRKEINNAENISEITCERCGKEGKLRGQLRWVTVYCDKCLEEIHAKK